MMHGISFRRLGVACAWLLAVGSTRVPAQETGGAPTDVVATVGDTPIFRSELDDVVRRSRGVVAASAALTADFAHSTGPGGRRWAEALAIEQLVDARLLRSEIEREQIIVGKDDLNARIDQLKQQMKARGVDWERFLAQSGREERVIREQLELEIALDRLIRPKLTPAAIAAGFEQQRRSLDGTRLRVSHIVLRPDAALGEEGVSATIERAAAIRRSILQGTISFADAARRHSAGPSRFTGGDMGWISREGPLVDAFASEAYTLAKGDISKPFVTSFGVHIAQVTGIESGQGTLEVLRPKIEAMLAENLLRDTLARLRATTPITYAAGIAHFDHATPAAGATPRRVVVGPVGDRPAP